MTVAGLCAIVCSLSIYCCRPHDVVTEVVEPKEAATSAVIFLHGAGESGPVLRARLEKLIKDFSRFPNTRFIFPTAEPVIFIPLPWNGEPVNMWIRVSSLAFDATYNTSDMDNSADKLTRLIEEQVASGIPHNRICIVGHSSGGLMSIYYGYEYMKNVGCIGSISGFLSPNTGLYRKAVGQPNDLGKNLPPLYLYAAALDPVILPSWTEDTCNVMKAAGINVTYNYEWFATHFMTKQAVEGFLQFMEQTILS